MRFAYCALPRFLRQPNLQNYLRLFLLLYAASDLPTH
jgi:hypothetical protein